MTRHERRLMWQERVDQCRASGMSVAAWCRENEVPEQQMYYWLRKFPSEEADAVEDDIQWIQLGRWDRQAALRMTGDSAVRIHIGRAMVEVRPGFAPALLRGVVKVLVGSC